MRWLNSVGLKAGRPEFDSPHGRSAARISASQAFERSCSAQKRRFAYIYCTVTSDHAILQLNLCHKVSYASKDSKRSVPTKKRVQQTWFYARCALESLFIVHVYNYTFNRGVTLG